MTKTTRTQRTLLVGGATIGLIAAAVMLFARWPVTRYVTPTGLSSGSCTITQPCTLTRAAALTRAGDSILLRGGVYSNTRATIALSGTALLPISIASYPNETAILDGGGPSVIADTDSIFLLSNSAFVTVRGITLQNSGGRGLSIYSPRAGATHHITIDSVTVLHVGQRALGGSGDDIILRNVYVEYASEDNTTDGSGSGWAGGISSYTHGDGAPARRWSLTDSHVAYIHGECVIAYNVDGWVAERNTFSNCYHVYNDKARNVVWSGNTIVQQPGWGKRGTNGDGFKMANELPQLVPPLYIESVSFVNNVLIGVRDCFSYWQAGGTYSNILIQGNDCRSNTGWLANYATVPTGQARPAGNVLAFNLCTRCDVFLGNSEGWTVSYVETDTPTPTDTDTPSATPTATPTWTPTDTPSNTPTAALTCTK